MSEIDMSEMAVLRRVKFPHVLNDDHWQMVLNECGRLKIHPSDIAVKLEENDDTGQLEPKIILTLLSLRQIAERTGKRRGERPPVYIGRDGACVSTWVSDEPPMEARAIVLRTDTDEEFEGVATFKRTANWSIQPDGTAKLTPGWDRDPAQQLGKCAIVAAYRAAFGAYLGNAMSIEENSPESLPKFSRKSQEALAAAPVPENLPTFARPSPPVIMPVSRIPDDPAVAARLIDESTPSSTSRLRLELMEMGVTPFANADALVNTFARKYPRVAAMSVQALCAVAIETVRKNPGQYLTMN